jgi:hypothetical protein
MPYQNLETNNFQDRRAEFDAKVDVDQKESVYIGCAIFNCSRAGE